MSISSILRASERPSVGPGKNKTGRVSNELSDNVVVDSHRPQSSADYYVGEERYRDCRKGVKDIK